MPFGHRPAVGHIPRRPADQGVPSGAREINWAAIQWFLARYLDEDDSRTRVEYTNLSDIYHALGACSISSAAATFCYAALFTYLFHAAVPTSPGRSAATAVAVGALLGISRWVFGRGRYFANGSLTRLLTNLIHTKAAGTPTPRPGEKRRHDRHEVPREALATIWGADGACDARVVNGSRGGMALAPWSSPPATIERVVVKDGFARPCLDAPARIAQDNTGPDVVRVELAELLDDELWISRACGYGRR